MLQIMAKITIYFSLSCYFTFTEIVRHRVTLQRPCVIGLYYHLETSVTPDDHSLRAAQWLSAPNFQDVSWLWKPKIIKTIPGPTQETTPPCRVVQRKRRLLQFEDQAFLETFYKMKGMNLHKIQRTQVK